MSSIIFFPKQVFRAITCIFCCCLLSSCQKEVHLNLESEPTRLVVQGEIENGKPPFVVLTSTIGFFSTINLTTLQDIFIHGAKVTVSDGVSTIELLEYTIDTAGSSKYYVYSVDTVNLSGILLGELNKYYTLSIDYLGKHYTSVTKIPYPKGLDTMWFGEPIFKGPGTPNNALELFGNYTDPDTLGNYVRYFTRRNNDVYYPGGIFSDEIVNGKRVTNVDLFAGFNDSTNVKQDSVIYFYPGDSVAVKWCEIDKPVYDFWNTYQFSVQSGGNPFASPINIKSNISNGALGVWAGYGTLYSYLVVK